MGSAYQIHDQSAIYFGTFQVVGWADIFTRKRYRDLIIESLVFCQKEKGLLIYSYVIMSNHVHCVIAAKEDNLSEIVRDFKRFTSRSILKKIESSRKESRRKWLMLIFRFHARFNKRVGERQLWTHENHFVEVNNNRIFERTLNYIHNNPVKAGIVAEPWHYLYSSASNYAGNEGLLDVIGID